MSWAWLTSPGSEYRGPKEGPRPCCVGGQRDDRRPNRAPGKIGWNQEAVVSWMLVTKMLEAERIAYLGFLLLTHERK